MFVIVPSRNYSTDLAYINVTIITLVISPATRQDTGTEEYIYNIICGFLYLITILLYNMCLI